MIYNMKFTENDIINIDSLNKRAMTEAKAIYSKESTRKGRSLDEVYSSTRYSHIAEQYLIDCQGFTDDTRPFKDVIDSNGVSVEVKVTSSSNFVPFIIDRANECMLSWRAKTYSKVLYIFVAGKSELAEYTLHGIYKWNGKTFVESFEHELG